MTSVETVNHLHKQLVLWQTLSLAAIAAGGVIVWLFSPLAPGDIAGWAVISGLASLIMFRRLDHLLPDNHRPDEAYLLPTLGTGTLLTSLRGLFFCLLIGIIAVPALPGWTIWLPGALYSIGSIIDFLDGYYARKENHATLLGSRFDLDLDGFGSLAAPLIGVWIGQLPIWYLLTGLARYVYIALLWLQSQQGHPIYPLSPSARRRVLASFHMGFVSVVLFPVYTPPGISAAAGVFMIVFLSSFVRDWLVASGALKPDSESYRALAPGLTYLLVDVLPLLARIMVPLCILSLLLNMPQSLDTRILVGLYSISGLMILFGVAGRMGALMCLLTTGGLIRIMPLDVLSSLLIGMTIWLWLFGTGPFSLWKPEERILYQRE